MLLNEKFRPFILVILVGTLMLGSAVFAVNNDYVLSLLQAKIVINGAEKQGSDKPFQYFNGQTYVPTSLIYKGTTYVPLRFFSEALNQPIKYESKTSTIFVGQISANDMVEQYMSDILKPYYNDSFTRYEVNGKMSIAGKSYNKGYSITSGLNPGTISFNLDAKYSNIYGLVGLDDSLNKSSGSIQIYGDEKLIKTIDIEAGSLEDQLNLDVTGILKLEIIVKTYSKINLADLKIK
jgi:hypothetical protein